MTRTETLTLAARLAWRDLRGGLRGMRIVLACLALGVGAIGAVGSLHAALERGLATEGARMLGGDVAIENGSQPLPEALRGWIVGQGGQVSAIVRLRSLLVAASGTRQLIELQAVDPAYPLIGQVALTPPGALPAALGEGLVADPLVLSRLGLHTGDKVRLGDASFTLAATLDSQPDRSAGIGLIGPPVLMAASDLPRTGLIQPGALVTYEWRVRLRPQTAPAAFIEALRAAFPGTGWRIRDRTRADPGLDTALTQTSMFLVLVGLSALLVGGIGVATGVHAWLEGRARSIAILRCLGAEARLVFAMFLMQVLGLCSAGILFGVAIAALLPALALTAFGDQLPVPASVGFYPAPLALAALYGLLTATSFALWPLGRAARIPGAALFRDAIVPQAAPPRALRLATLATGAALIATIVATAESRRFALGFCAAAGLSLLVFRGGAWLVARAARLWAVRRPVWLRLGIGSLYRPGAQSALLITALGLGLTTLTTVALLQGNLRAQLTGSLPARAPSYFFVDIQNSQMAHFTDIVAAHPGATDLRQVPSLRARIVALNGVPADRVHVTPDSRWGLSGDRGLTYAATLPQGSRLAAGKWWPADYSGLPLLSLDEGLARGWGLKIGDTLRANVLGRDIDFRIANLRAIDWRGLNLNFTLVAAPGLLEHAPHMHIATLRTAPGTDTALLRDITDALPNVTFIPVAELLRTLAAIIGKLAAGLTAAGSVTLAAGALVLAGTIAAGQRRRINEAVILKTIGGTASQIRAAWLTEFAIIGATAGTIASALGTLASWAVMHFVLQAPWQFLPATLATTISACMLLMLLAGYAGTAAALRTRAAPLLRNQ